MLVVLVGSECGLVAGLHLAGRLTGPVPWHQLDQWLLHGDSEEVIVGVVRLVGLVLAWWLLVSSFAYLAARACRLERTSVALGRLTLPLVRRLVDSAMAASMMLSSVGAVGIVAASPASAAPPTATTATVGSAGTPLGAAAAPVVADASLTLPDQPALPEVAAHPQPEPGFPPDAAPTGTHWHVVQRGDSLWRLSQQQLGDGHRYREIWQLNRGRRMNDGRCFRNPDHIRPGWVLAIPRPERALTPPPEPQPRPSAPAQEPAPNPPAPPEPSPPSVTQPPAAPPASTPPSLNQPAPVAPAETAPPLEEPSDIAPPASTPPPMDRPPPVAPEASALPPPAMEPPPLGPPASAPPPMNDPPPVPAPGSTPPAVEEPAVIPAGVPATAPPEAVERPHGPGAAAEQGADLPISKIALAGLSGLVAAVVILGCRRLARRTTRTAPTGKDRTIPDEQERIETKVRAIAEQDAARWIDAAVRLYPNTGDAKEELPMIRAVRAGVHGVELLLAQPSAPATPGFLDEAGGWQWRLGLDLEQAEQQAAGRIAASPALVEVGRTVDGPLLINLEALDRLEVGGDPEMTKATLKAVAAQLACAPWAEGVEICLLGADLPLEGVGEAVNIESVAEAIERTHLAVAAATTREERFRPAVVVSTRALTTDELGALDELRPPGTPGFALVAPAPLPGAVGGLSFAADGTGRLEPMAIDLAAAPAWPDAADNIVSLLEAHATAAAPPEQQERGATLIEPSEPGPAPEPSGGDAPVGDSDRHLSLLIPASNGHRRLEVLVLGPVALAGTDASLHRHRMESQLLVRLAVVGGPYSAAKLREDLYPTGFITDNTWASLLRRARKRFGVDPLGHPVISPTTEGCLSISPWVSCDLQRFKELTTDAQPAGLKTALELVRGEPFDVLPNGYDWVTAGFVLRTQDMIAAAAIDLVNHALSNDDPDLALWAADQGLRAAPDSEPLRVARIRALVARGDTDAARHTLEDIEATARELGADMLPETAEIVQSLLGNKAGTPRRSADGNSR